MEKKQSKIIQFKQKGEEVKQKRKKNCQPESFMSNDEVNLNVKIVDMEHLLLIGETMVAEIFELEEKMHTGEASENFVIFLSDWSRMTESFSDYYDDE